MSADSDDMNFEQQSLALASEALRVTRTSNCTLFAIPDPGSEWGFVPESFLGSADWMFSVDGIQRSGISAPALNLAEKIQRPDQRHDFDPRSFIRNFMCDQEERVAMFELVKALFAEVPELDHIVTAAARTLDYDDFQTAQAD